MTDVVSYTSVSRILSVAPPALNSATTITSAVLAQYAGDVESEINSRLAKRYLLPLAMPCPILTAIATREAIFRTLVQRALIQFPPAQQGQHPLQLQHKDDQTLLDRLAQGDVQLVDSSGAIVSANLMELELYSTTEGYLPTFHEGAWNDQVQDKTKLDDILADRDM